MIPPEYYAFLVQKIELLQKDVTNLKETSKVSSNFFKQSVLLQRVCMVIIILLPITLTAVVATIAYVYCSDEQMISFAKWVLGILSMGSLIDLFVIFATHSIDQKRIEQIERRIDQLSKWLHYLYYIKYEPQFSTIYSENMILSRILDIIFFENIKDYRLEQ